MVIGHELRVVNSFGDGGDEIKVTKIWMDDGEEEYKSNILIEASARVMPLPDRISTYSPGSGSGGGGSGSQSGSVCIVTNDDINGFADQAALEAKLQEIYNSLNPAGQGSQGTDTVYDAFDLYQWSRTQHYTDDRFDELTDGKNAVGYLNDFYANNIQNGTFDPAEGSKYSDYKTYLDKISADGKLLNTGTVLSDENAWREEFRIRNGYKQGSWDLRDFREYLVGNNAIKQQHFFSTGT